MTDKKFTPGKNETPAPDTAGSKKPHATLDLKATEIKASATGDKGKSGSGAGTPGTFTSIPKPGEKPAAAKTDAPSAPKAEAPTTASSSAKPGDAQKSTAQPATEPTKSGSVPKSGASSGASKPSAPPPSARQRSGGGIGSFFTHLVAGIVGGFLALLGADSLQPQIAQLKSGLGLEAGASKADEGLGKLESRLAALEQSRGNGGDEASKALLAELAGTNAKIGELEALKDTVASLRATQDDLAQKSATLAEQVGQVPDAGAVPEGRLAKLEQQLSTMAAFADNSENSGLMPKLAGLTGRMSDLEETLKNQIAAVRSGVGEDVEARLAKVVEASEAARSGTQRMDRQLAGVATDAARFGQQLETVKADTTRLGDTLRVVQEETAKITSQLAGLEGDVTSKIAKLASPGDVEKAVKPVAEQVASLESRIANVVSAEKDRAQNAKRIVLALELGNLTRAIERGDGFADELAQVKDTAGGLIDVAKLEQYGASGVASLSTLQAAFRPVADSIVESASAPEGDSVFDQLLANARSVVKVRKVNHDPSDTSAEAVVGRMETALEAGRLSEVLSLADGLPERGKQAAAGFVKKVEERHAVDQALASIEDQLKASLSGTN